MPSIKYEFFMSRINHISDIKENEKIRISVVYDEVRQIPCVFKICKNRDLSEVYQAIMNIKHPNLTVIYDFIYENGNTYVMEEFLVGKTLSEIIEEKGVFSEKETARILRDVCSGLSVLHDCKPAIVHNDIKTSNIMLCEDGSVKLMDFDVSRTYKPGANKNTRLFGTEEYASPEHFGFGQSEPRSDIYTLGVTMHEMLTGESLANDHKMTYTGKLAKILAKCIQVDRKKRYSSVNELKIELEKHADRMRYIKHVGKFVKRSVIIWFIINFLYYLVASIVIATSITGEPDEIIRDKKDETVYQDTETKETMVTPALKNTSMAEETLINNSSNDEETTSNTEDILSDDQKNTEKKMEVVYNVEGTLHTLLAMPEDVFVILEEISGTYYIKTSAGAEKMLEGVAGQYGAKLVYNSYSDSLYLLEYTGYEIKVYEVSSDFEINYAASINRTTFSDKSYLTCGFFSDGIMLCNAIFGLVDSQNWTLIGEAPAGAYVINDKIYGTQSGGFFEMNAQGDIIKEYKVQDISVSGSNEQIYADGKYAYFVGVNGGQHYVYQFDGQSYEMLTCLDDYKYYTYFDYDHVCVSENAIRCYDTELNVIKEFKI